MLATEKVMGRKATDDEAFVIYFITAKRHGSQRFGDRASALKFAIEIFEELCAHPPA